MGDGEQRPISKADLARHWGVSRPYVTKLSKPETEGGKSLPVFYDLADADAWRAVHAPERASRVVPTFTGEQSFNENSVEAEKKSSGPADTTSQPKPRDTARGRNSARGGAKDAGGEWLPAKIDVQAMVRRDIDFDVLMVQHAEEVPQIAHGLLKMAAETGHPNAISAATRNWHEAADASADVRERFLSLQEKSRALLPLDEVMDIVGTELQAVRVALMKLGERCANEANPADPALAQRVIDAAIDLVFAKLSGVEIRAARELSVAPAS
jgi:hypothetical protein